MNDPLEDRPTEHDRSVPATTRRGLLTATGAAGALALASSGSAAERDEVFENWDPYVGPGVEDYEFEVLERTMDRRLPDAHPNVRVDGETVVLEWTTEHPNLGDTERPRGMEYDATTGEFAVDVATITLGGGDAYLYGTYRLTVTLDDRPEATQFRRFWYSDPEFPPATSRGRPTQVPLVDGGEPGVTVPDGTDLTFEVETAADGYEPAGNPDPAIDLGEARTTVEGEVTGQLSECARPALESFATDDGRVHATVGIRMDEPDPETSLGPWCTAGDQTWGYRLDLARGDESPAGVSVLERDGSADVRVARGTGADPVVDSSAVEAYEFVARSNGSGDPDTDPTATVGDGVLRLQGTAPACLASSETLALRSIASVDSESEGGGTGDDETGDGETGGNETGDGETGGSGTDDAHLEVVIGDRTRAVAPTYPEGQSCGHAEPADYELIVHLAEQSLDRLSVREVGVDGASETTFGPEPRSVAALGEHEPRPHGWDGLYRDVTGDGDLTLADVSTFQEHIFSDAVQDNAAVYDFSDSADGRVSHADVVALFWEVTGI